MRTKEQSIHGGQMLSSRLLYFIITIDGSIYSGSDPHLHLNKSQEQHLQLLFLSCCCCGSLCQYSDGSDSDHPLTLLPCLSEGRVGSETEYLNLLK